MCSAVILTWLIIMLPAKPPSLIDKKVLRFKDLQDRQDDLARELSTVEGVEEVIIMAPQQVVYLKVDAEQLDLEALDKYETAV